MKLEIKSIRLYLVFYLITLYGCIDSKEKTAIVISENKSQDVKGIWIDYIIGVPPMANEFIGIDSLTKKYKINYKRELLGCESSEEDVLNIKKAEIANQIYFKKLELTLGKNWKKNFDLEKQKLDNLNFKNL